LRNQLTQNSFGQLVGVGGLADVEPVLHVVAGVVAHERQHGEGVEADFADGAGGGCGLLRAHDRAEEGAVLPVEGLGHQRDVGGPAAAEEDGRDRHALRVLPLGSIDGHCEAGAVKRALGWAAGVADSGVQSLPFQSIRWAALSSVRPSHQTSPSSVRATLVKIELPCSEADGVRVGRLVAGAGGHAEEAGLGVDGVEAAVLAELHPGDVVADGLALPAREGGDEHGHVGLAAGRREGAGDVLLLARVGEPTMSMCSAIQPSSRAMVEAMRRAKHFLPSRALPP
jgi:hypothetical protein